jgi:hypothetical protein
MSYFVCNHGEKYFPFGKGGKPALLQRLQQLRGADSDGKASAALDRLLSCPMHCFPLTEAMSQEEIPVGNDSIAGDGPQHEEPTSALVTVRSPESETSRSFGYLADDLVVELLRLQMEAQLVSSSFMLDRTADKFAGTLSP